MKKYNLHYNPDDYALIIPNKGMYILPQHLNILSDIVPEDIPNIIDPDTKLFQYAKTDPSYIFGYDRRDNNEVLSQEGNCWIGPSTSIHGKNIRIKDNALVTGILHWYSRYDSYTNIKGNNITIGDDALIYMSTIHNQSKCRVYILNNAYIIDSSIIIYASCDADIIISNYTTIINSTIEISDTWFRDRTNEHAFERIYITNATLGSSIDKPPYKISISSNSITNENKFWIISDNIPGSLNTSAYTKETPNTETPDIKWYEELI